MSLQRGESFANQDVMHIGTGALTLHCALLQCLSTLLKYPYLLEEEEVHEPAEEEDEEACEPPNLSPR